MLLDLPVEIIYDIILLCSETDHLNLRNTNSILNRLMLNSSCWLLHLEKELGPIAKSQHPTRNWFEVYNAFHKGWANLNSERRVESTFMIIDGLLDLPGLLKYYWHGQLTDGRHLLLFCQTKDGSTFILMVDIATWEQVRIDTATLQSVDWPEEDCWPWTTAAYHCGLLALAHGDLHPQIHCFTIDASTAKMTRFMLDTSSLSRRIHAITINQNYIGFAMSTEIILFCRQNKTFYCRLSTGHSEICDFIVHGNSVTAVTESGNILQWKIQHSTHQFPVKSGYHERHVIPSQLYLSRDGSTIQERWITGFTQHSCGQIIELDQNLKETSSISGLEEFRRHNFNTRFPSPLMHIDELCQYFVIASYTNSEGLPWDTSRAPDLYIYDSITRKTVGPPISVMNIPEDLGAFIDFTVCSYNILCFFQSGIVRLSLRHCDLRTVVVQDLDPSTDDDDLYDRFAIFGNINTYYVDLDDSGRSNGFGFIQYETKKAAGDAIISTDGSFLNGRKIVVQYALSEKDQYLRFIDTLSFENSRSRTLSIRKDYLKMHSLYNF